MKTRFHPIFITISLLWAVSGVFGKRYFNDKYYPLEVPTVDLEDGLIDFVISENDLITSVLDRITDLLITPPKYTDLSTLLADLVTGDFFTKAIGNVEKIKKPADIAEEVVRKIFLPSQDKDILALKTFTEKVEFLTEKAALLTIRFQKAQILDLLAANSLQPKRLPTPRQITSELLSGLQEAAKVYPNFPGNGVDASQLYVFIQNGLFTFEHHILQLQKRMIALADAVETLRKDLMKLSFDAIGLANTDKRQLRLNHPEETERRILTLIGLWFRFGTPGASRDDEITNAYHLAVTLINYTGQLRPALSFDKNSQALTQLYNVVVADIIARLHRAEEYGVAANLAQLYLRDKLGQTNDQRIAEQLISYCGTRLSFGNTAAEHERSGDHKFIPFYWILYDVCYLNADPYKLSPNVVDFLLANLPTFVALDSRYITGWRQIAGMLSDDSLVDFSLAHNFFMTAVDTIVDFLSRYRPEKLDEATLAQEFNNFLDSYIVPEKDQKALPAHSVDIYKLIRMNYLHHAPNIVLKKDRKLSSNAKKQLNKALDDPIFVELKREPIDFEDLSKSAISRFFSSLSPKSSPKEKVNSKKQLNAKVVPITEPHRENSEFARRQSKEAQAALADRTLNPNQKEFLENFLTKFHNKL